MEAWEYWKLPVSVVPLQLVIASITTAGRFLSLIALAIVSNDYPWKPCKLGLDFDVFSWVTPSNPRVGVHVNVLLHELYPAKEASAAGPVDLDGRLSPQDFIQALQKIDLEGLPNNLDESSFIFQPTDLSTCSTSWTPNLNCKPSPSNDDTVELLPVSRCTPSPAVEPMFSPMSADPLWSDTDKVEVINPDTTASSEIPELPGLIDPRSDIAATVGVEGACLSLHAPSTITSLQSENPTNTAEDDDLDAKILPPSVLSLTSGAPNIWTVGGCNTHESPTVCFKNNVEPVRPFPRVLRLNSDMLFGTTSSNEAKVNSEDPIPENVQPTDCPVVASNCVSSTPTENLSRTSRRKSVLKPLQVGQRRSRSTSFSSTSDLEPLSGSSQDSELSYRPFILKQSPGPSNRTSGPIKRISLCSVSSKSCGSLSTNGSLFESTGDISVFDREESSTPSPFQHGGSLSSDFIASQRSLSRRGDYVQRDIAALEHAHVPFSYEEIVGASNEKFREMKSTPYLTPHQMDVLITARKRATNRQAAERCRRLKLATRDDLSEQLAALRTERQVLVRQIAQARQRKQRASDALLAEQKRVLSLLCGPEGDRLKYSDWRVRLTHDDEVVVVAVGR
ncbi:hypothetical protein T265_10965 [Opisthorchis viverrini]|uniref:Basic leucine zipper domain-containing protein n=1 Tax=Opisthorchis viverrini TaxID=6198 RepID=A0A074Z4P4_OPIVI|nr:hypothetical protein T265_10965 [Opisthorchis viverrini]KER20497.1 hypothetical protein T265_10965 [Opisthorchis viverrini]